MRTPKRISSVAAAAAVAALLAAGSGVAAVRTGTPRADTLVGTHSTDKLIGLKGDDLLKGLAGDDVYVFGDRLGTDTVQERATYTVDGKTKPGGKDTLNFSQATGTVSVWLIPEAGPGKNAAYRSDGTRVYLGTSIVENVVGIDNDVDFDLLVGGAGPNVINGNGGDGDRLRDYGGYSGDDSIPALPASNDTYRGVAKGRNALIADYGGDADVLELTPLKRDAVAFVPVDWEGDGVAEDLRIVVGETDVATVFDHYGNGRIEQFVFADGTVPADEIGGGASAIGRQAERSSVTPDGPRKPGARRR